MKKQTAVVFAVLGIWSLVAFASPFSFAQTNSQNDQLLNDILTSDRGYATTDKDLVKVTAKTATTATLEAPLAKKDGKDVTSYYITWAPISYKDITTSSNTDDLKAVKTSDDVKATDGTPIYKVQGNKLVFTIDITDPSKDIYVTIAPEDANKKTGNQIEDFKFNLSTVSVSTTAVAGDTYSTTSNQAIDNVTCVWDATDNRVTLTWDINTAMSQATKVQIYHRPDENQGDMTLKGTPAITDRRFPVDTPHRNIQLFRLKPIDAAGTMVGKEIQYLCKPDGNVTSDTTPSTPVTPSDPAKPIPVTPHTGPLETTAAVFFISLLLYTVYRKMKA